MEAKEQTETDAEKYTELYDFAPAGYFLFHDSLYTIPSGTLKF